MVIHDSDGDNDDDGDDGGDDDGDDGDDLSSWHTQATHVGHPSCHPAPSNLSLGIPQAIFHESGEIKPSWQPISLHHRQIVKIMFFRQAWWETFNGDDDVDIGKGDDDIVDIGKGDDVYIGKGDDEIGKGDDDDDIGKGDDYDDIGKGDDVDIGRGDDEIVDIGKGDDDDEIGKGDDDIVDIGKGDDDDHRQRLFGTSTPVQHQIWTAVEKAHLHLWAKILSIDIKQLLPFLSNL